MVVSDSSPIINLAVIGRLELLAALYETVHVPEAVFREVTRYDDLPGAREIQTLDWFVRRTCKRKDLIAAIGNALDIGEAEAIALAVENDAGLLIDEKKGRLFAARLGVRQRGLLGVLVEAKKKGHIEEIRPLLHKLQEKAGFWMSQELRDRVLALVSESVL